MPKACRGWGPPLPSPPIAQFGKQTNPGTTVTILDYPGPMDFQSSRPDTETQTQEEEEFRC